MKKSYLILVAGFICFEIGVACASYLPGFKENWTSLQYFEAWNAALFTLASIFSIPLAIQENDK